jgi:ribosomal protein S27E
MANVISGTKQNKDVKVVKAEGNNISKVRCQFCKHTLAHPTPDGKGGTVLRCGTCGRTFTFKTM